MPSPRRSNALPRCSRIELIADSNRSPLLHDKRFGRLGLMRLDNFFDGSSNQVELILGELAGRFEHLQEMIDPFG